MNPLRRRQLLRTILETLGFAEGYAIPEQQLRVQVDGLTRPPTGDEEWAWAIGELSGPSRNAIKRIEDGLDPELVQWARTERGKILFETLG